jgi:CHAT domain-containing protein
MALVVPDDSQLAQAPAEKNYLLSLANGGRKVEVVPATYLAVTDAMAKGVYDAWHFTGHGRAHQGGDADQAAILLSNRDSLKPEDIIGEVENVLLPSPFVFLNACQSAQAGLSLTGVGGWARRFLRPPPKGSTASAFVGSYWSVADDAAFAFASALYKALLAGQPIGTAARDARLAVRQQEDPTWLAYTVYADPHATVM